MLSGTGRRRESSRPVLDDGIQPIRIQQESVVPVRGWKGRYFSAVQLRRERLDVSHGKKDIRGYTHEEHRLLKSGSFFCGSGSQTCFFQLHRGGLETQIMGIRHVREADIAVRIKASDQLAPLVMQIGLH